MPDKVSPGQRASASPLRKAAFVNDVIDTVADYKGRSGPLSSAGSSKSSTPNSAFVEVKNLTGGDLLRGSVVQLGSHLLTDLTPTHYWFEGNLVDEPVNRRLAIIREPMPVDKIDKAILAGVCIARVDVTDASHRFAIATAGETALASATDGAIELLIDPTGTGEQELVVLLGGSAAGRDCPRITFSAPSAFDATDTTIADCEVLATRGGRITGAETGDTVSIENETGWAGDETGIGYAEWDDERELWLLYLYQCPASAES